MKKTGRQETETTREGKMPQLWESHALFDLFSKNRVLREKKGVPVQDQIIAFLTKQGKRDKTSRDLKDTSYSISYRFGQWRLDQYPEYSARMDKRQSMRTKQRELVRIGMKKSNIEIFGQIGDPEWGQTFRGVGAKDEFFQFEMQRQTYTPFRQELRFQAGPNDEFNWQYAFTLYTPDSLYFWKPNDTMGVNTPEFKRASWIWEPVTLSGELDRQGRLIVSDVHFGGMHSRTGVPNYEVEKQSRSKIVLAQLRDGFTNETNRKYVIQVPHLRQMMAWIQQDDALINTNPLFPFHMTGEPVWNVSIDKKA